MDLVNPTAQANELGRIRLELTKVARAMDDYSAFDEISKDVKEAKKILLVAELEMKKKIRENNRG